MRYLTGERRGDCKLWDRLPFWGVICGSRCIYIRDYLTCPVLLTNFLKWRCCVSKKRDRLIHNQEDPFAHRSLDAVSYSYQNCPLLPGSGSNLADMQCRLMISDEAFLVDNHVPFVQFHGAKVWSFHRLKESQAVKRCYFQYVVINAKCYQANDIFPFSK